MDNSMVEKVEDLLDDSFDTFVDKKNFVKTQNKMLGEIAKKNGLEKSLLKRLVKYQFYSTKGWMNDNPLELDPTAEVKDKLTPIFAKLRDVLMDVSTVGATEIVMPYIEALEKVGIKITFEDITKMDIKDTPETIMDTVNSACNLQKNIDTLDEEIKETKATESEEMGFTPKSSFGNVLSTYARIKEGKGDKVEDKIQDSIANGLMMVDAFNYLSKKIETSEE